MTHYPLDDSHPIRVGVVGFGTSGAVFHAPVLAASPDYVLDSVVTRDPARRAALAERYPGTVAVDSIDDLLARDLDLVVVGSPVALHAEHARAALEAGVAVVVDKPFTVHAADAAELIATAERHGAPLTVFQNRRFDDDFLTVQREIASGRLGRVRSVESRFEVDKPTITKAWKAAATPDEGGGVLYDLGSHLLDQVIRLSGPVSSLVGGVKTLREGGRSDDEATLLLTHGEGPGAVESKVVVSTLAPQPGPRWTVTGTEGTLTILGLDEQEAQLGAGGSPADEGYGRRQDPGAATLTSAGGSRTPVELETGDYPEFYSRLARALRGQGDLPVDPHDSQRVVEIIETVHRGAAAAGTR